MSYLKDREIWLSNVPTSNPPAGYVWVFIQNGVFVVRDSNGLDKIMATTTGTVTNATSASYVEYSNVASKPALISGSSQVSYTGLSNIPVGIVSGSSQVTYSGLTGVPSGIVSGSAQIASFGIFATTGSNGFNGSQSITGSLTVTGQVVAQTLNVQQVTSSIVYSSGSNIFGNSLGNTQQFTGSVGVTGSLTVAGAGTFSGALSLNSSANRVNSGNELRFYRTDNGIYTQLYDGGAANGFVLDNRNGDGFSFQTAGTNQLRIASTGAATFLGPTVTIGNAVAATNVKLFLNGVASKAAGIEFQQNGTSQWYIGNGIASEDNNFELYNSNGTMAMKIIKSTNAINFIGAATFSSSVTTSQLVSLSPSGTAALFLKDASANNKWEIGHITNNLYFYNYTTGTNPLVITGATGAATFSSSVTATSFSNAGLQASEVFNATKSNAGYFVGYFQNTSATGLGIYIQNGNDSNDCLRIGNAAGSANPIKLFGSGKAYFAGNVGIGTESPEELLDIRGANRDETSAQYNQVIYSTSTHGINRGGSIGLGGATNGTATITAFGAIKGGKENDTAGNTAGALLFLTRVNAGPITEKARITSGGDVLIGCTSVPGAGSATNGASLGNTGFITAQRAAATVGYFGRSNAGELFAFYNNTTQVGNISIGASTTSYNTTSDYRLKEDLKEINGLEKISALKVYDFKFKNSENRMDGVLAHELAEVLPYAVHGEKDGEEMQGVDYSKIVPVLVKSIQEQQTLIESLKSRIEILEQ